VPLAVYGDEGTLGRYTKGCAYFAAVLLRKLLKMVLEMLSDCEMIGTTYRKNNFLGQLLHYHTTRVQEITCQVD
jgi:hypothetical protein